jgi:hypothetical protein
MSEVLVPTVSFSGGIAEAAAQTLKIERKNFSLTKIMEERVFVVRDVLGEFCYNFLSLSCCCLAWRT